jgi:hypothetical protein
MDAAVPQSRVDLYWLPLGAGARIPVVRWNGRLYVAFQARRERRATCDLFHAALVVVVDSVPFVIEVAPVWSGGSTDRGVIIEGPVGSRWLGRSRLFRYEVRRWRDGVIPDIEYAVGGARRMTDDPLVSQRILDLVADVPVVTWGRDEFHTGDMWNSNSVVAWLLATGGLDVELVRLPVNGRAPGWLAGLRKARG